MAKPINAIVQQGTVTGVMDCGVCRFSAIPFAQAPIGALRFCPPQPAAWGGTLNATERGPVAPQLPSRLRRAMGDFTAIQSEDCLHLTVWTPGVDQRRRPVLVWLHGGAWQSGGGDQDWYSGAQLALRGDMVVVAPNYRLAALGWLAVTGETANVGLLDQESALDWVHANIESFGGDPERITVMGQSAGAMSIACLLMRKPRFQQAIMQSAPLGRGFRSAKNANEIASIILQAAGADSLDAARHLSVEALLKAQQAPQVVDWLSAESTQRSLFAPVADGIVLPDAPDEILLKAAARADVIVGCNRDEMAAFPDMGIDERSHALGEKIYCSPSRQWAASAAAQGRKAWSYRFDFRPTDSFGACHCIELPFVFGTQAAFADAPMMRGIQQQDMTRLSANMQQYWIAFIREGNPGWEHSPYEKYFE